MRTEEKFGAGEDATDVAYGSPLPKERRVETTTIDADKTPTAQLHHLRTTQLVANESFQLGRGEPSWNSKVDQPLLDMVCGDAISMLDLKSKSRMLAALIYQEACQAQVALFRITRSEEDSSASISMSSRGQARCHVGSEAHRKLTAAAVSMFIARSQVLGVSITDDREWPRYLSEQPPDTPAKVSVAEHFIDKASNALDLGDRSLAGTYLEEARVLLRDNSPEFMSSNGEDIMHQLGVHASVCFRMHGARAFADEAVSFFEFAVKCSRGSPFRHHFALTEILTDRIRTYPDPKSAAKALEHATAAQGTCPLGNLALRGECHRLRGRSLQAIYHAHRDLASLQDSITALVEAARMIPRSSPTLGLAYNDLGNAYALLQEYEDARANLGLSIGAYKSAMDVFNELLRSDPGLKSNIAMIYNSLGQAMWLRSRRFHNESDVSFALDCFKKSIQEIDEEYPAFALRVSNLSCASWVRYEATGNQELLVEADNEIQRALNTPITLAPDIISSLKTQRGIMALQLAKKATPQQVAAYDRAITLLREALELDAREVRNVTLATILVDLALAQEGRARLSHKAQDFEDAFETFQRAENAVPKHDPVHWVARFNHTGLRHNLLMELEHSGGSAEESLSTRGPSVLQSWISLADDTSIFTSFRLEAASGAAVLAQMLGRNVVALSYQNLALQLLPQIIAGSMTRPEQLRLIRKYYHVPFVGAMLSLAAGDRASEAIWLFESGRSFLWDRLLIQKTPIEELAQAHPQLAAVFDAARAAITAGGSHSAIRLEAQFIGAVRAPGHLDREEKWRIYEEVLQSIRHEPGFEDFMRLPSQPESLEKYAVDAPIVYVNAHQWRSDALVIARDRVYNVALPLFTMQDIERRALDMVAARHALGQGPKEAARGMDQFDDIMAWLWDAVARPILDSMDFSKYPKIGQARKPKVIWVAAGWVNILPIHAAGRYGSRGAQGAPSCVHDVVVSAYTTSLRALKYSRERELLLRTRELSVSSPPPPQKMLLVAMEHTTGRNDLPEAVREVTAVKERLGPGVDCTILEHPDVRTTKAALAGADLAYFACHSQASHDDPSQSAILLGDGRPESLSVRVLLNTAMERCSLVYLSSCESGLNKDFLLSEEGLSVAGAFHMAGVPHAGK